MELILIYKPCFLEKYLNAAVLRKA